MWTALLSILGWLWGKLTAPSPDTTAIAAGKAEAQAEGQKGELDEIAKADAVRNASPGVGGVRDPDQFSRD